MNEESPVIELFNRTLPDIYRIFSNLIRTLFTVSEG